MLSESVMMMGAAADNGDEVYLVKVKVSTKFCDIFNIQRRDMVS